MENLITWFSAHWQELLLIVTSTVTVASLIAKLTPTEADDKFVQKILDFINLLALNKKQ